MSSTPIEPTKGRSEKASTRTAKRAKAAETPTEYTRRILSYVEGKDAMAVLKSTPERLRRIVHTTPTVALHQQPAEGRWSPTQIITHLADAEIVVSYRIRMILSQNAVDIQAFDQDKWAAKLVYEKADPLESVELFTVARGANIHLLARVDRRLHNNYGMHSERGKETISHLIRLYAGHDLNHLSQLERTVG